MDLATIKGFRLERILNQDPHLKSVNVLGTLPKGGDSIHAILIIQKTPLDADNATDIGQLFQKIEVIENNDIYSWMLGWLGGDGDSPADVKVNVIAPCTDVHIQKYSAQKQFMVSETPALYRGVTLPFISSIPTSRIQWVYNILNHITEADQILFEDPSTTSGFILLPDMKWDRKTLSSLYLVAIVHSRDMKSLRDLRKSHLPLLRSIKKEASKVVQKKWGVEKGGLRFYIHYQPSYYQFHVHIVTTEYTGSSGMNVGQAHLLEDVISLLELENEKEPIFEKMTLTYVLGEKHGLYEGMRSAGAFIDE